MDQTKDLEEVEVGGNISSGETKNQPKTDLTKLSKQNMKQCDSYQRGRTKERKRNIGTKTKITLLMLVVSSLFLFCTLLKPIYMLNFAFKTRTNEHFIFSRFEEAVFEGLNWNIQSISHSLNVFVILFPVATTKQ